jgi:hypothetical protein
MKVHRFVLRDDSRAAAISIWRREARVTLWVVGPLFSGVATRDTVALWRELWAGGRVAGERVARRWVVALGFDADDGEQKEIVTGVWIVLCLYFWEGVCVCV